MSTPWTSHAAAYGFTAATVSGVVRPPVAAGARGASISTTGRRVERVQPLVDGDEPRGRNAPERRLVHALPGSEARMPLERVDDLVEQGLVREVAVEAGEREPHLQAGALRRVELLPDGEELRRDRRRRPFRVVADVIDAGARDLLPGRQAAVRSGAVDRRRVGEAEREGHRLLLSPAGVLQSERRVGRRLRRVVRWPANQVRSSCTWAASCRCSSTSKRASPCPPTARWAAPCASSQSFSIPAIVQTLRARPGARLI